MFTMKPAIFLAAAAIIQPGFAALQVRALRCEYRVDPAAIEESAPRLSWEVDSAERGQKQTAYRVLVASSEALLAANQGDLWDSGRVAGSETNQIAYAGKPLASRQYCHWKVQAWDKEGKPSAWSSPARWSMGLLHAADWKAQWISYRDRTPLHTSRTELFLPPARYYRKQWTATKPVRRAVLYCSALGIYEASLNGRRVSNAMFAPGWSDYRLRAYYNGFEVTSLVRQGANALGAIVADGWYSGYLGYGLLLGYGPHKTGRYFYGKTPALLAQLEIDYADGTKQTVATDATWKVSTGPIIEADMLMGETYDARLEFAGWDQSGFAESRWESAVRAEENGSVRAPFSDRGGDREVELGFVPPKRMQAHSGVPVRPTEEIKPVSVTERAPGVYVFDMGQNFAGVVRLKLRGTAGTSVRLRYAEMLHPDGRLATENLRRARATDSYILRGDPAGETWTPRFTYHGFQYVEASGYPGKPGLDAVTGIVIHSDTPLASSFSASDDMVNRLFRNIVWTQRANFVEIPTDCPQRDERLGWTGDAQAYIRAAAYNADVAAFFTKWLDDLEEAQRANGAYPDYAPYPMQHGVPTGGGYGTAWMDAGLICPYTIYQVYGDRRVIDRHYNSMRRFMEFRQRRSRDFRGASDGNTWGDWLAIGSQTPLEYIDAAYFALTSRMMSEMAAATDRKEDAASYADLFAKVSSAFQKDYLRPGGVLAVDNQSAYSLALFAGVLPEAIRPSAAARLAQLIASNNNRMTTGFLGTRPLLPVLSAAGHHDLAVRLFQSREFPSWGYEVANGATSIWERWNSYTKEKGLHEPAMNSFSHYAFGAVAEWMFRTLGGIDTDGPGFRKLLLRPSPPAPGSNPTQTPIHWVKAEHASIRGKITSQWRLEGSAFYLEVTVPANTSATLLLPATRPESILENGKPLSAAPGVRLLGQEGDRARLAIESGIYRFASDWRAR
jgi:alpha-L-rhamnosidase